MSLYIAEYLLTSHTLIPPYSISITDIILIKIFLVTVNLNFSNPKKNQLISNNVATKYIPWTTANTLYWISNIKIYNTYNNIINKDIVTWTL